MVLAYILIGVCAFIVLLVVVVATRPADFRIVRSATMGAAPADVFAQVNDFHKWEAWSPWAKLDPSMTQTYGGPPSGVGATTHWTGNSKVGEGRMTIMDSRPSELIRIKLDFLRPFKANNTAEFTFLPQASQTMVTWTMIGQKNFMMKGFGLIMNMDKLIGADFEKGLASMKTVVESVKK